MTLMKRHILASCLILTVIFARESRAQTVYQELRDVLAAAAESGSASGIMVGPIADKFTRQFRSEGSLLVQARVVKPYKRPGCFRMNAVFTKKDVSTPIGRTDANLRMNMNYCIDGSMPSDLE